jgi:glycosyltransferase involved in cell wall biosynthesis
MAPVSVDIALDSYPSTDQPGASPVVSVVIPLYNAQEWISETLKSVRAQTYEGKKIEIIIVDDGSTDNSVAAAEIALVGTSLAHRIIRTSNGGPARARNIGWRQSTGNWIQFLDADDLLSPQKIALQIKAGEVLRRQVAVVYSPWQRIELVQGCWRPMNNVVAPAIGKAAVSDLLRDENFIATGSQLFHRCWLEQVAGFDEQHWLIEDVDLLLRIAMAGGSFYHVHSDAPLFLYRQIGTSSLSQRSKREFIEGCLRNARMVEAHWQSAGTLTPAQVSLLVGIYFQGARHYAASDWQMFESIVDKIETLAPGFIPGRPAALNRLSRVMGYRRAERVAVIYRQLKSYLTQL